MCIHQQNLTGSVKVVLLCYTFLYATKGKSVIRVLQWCTRKTPFVKVVFQGGRDCGVADFLPHITSEEVNQYKVLGGCRNVEPSFQTVTRTIAWDRVRVRLHQV
jgi:hypothetical protein